MELEKKVKLSCVSAALVNYINRRLFGSVFTVLDASISDVESRKASKSLVSQAFTRETKQFMSELINLSKQEE